LFFAGDSIEIPSSRTGFLGQRFMRKYCYLCHDSLEPSLEGTIFYNESSNPHLALYACSRCVFELGTDEAFSRLEEHYEHRASLRDTLPSIDKEAMRKFREEMESQED